MRSLVIMVALLGTSRAHAELSSDAREILVRLFPKTTPPLHGQIATKRNQSGEEAWSGDRRVTLDTRDDGRAVRFDGSLDLDSEALEAFFTGQFGPAFVDAGDGDARVWAVAGTRFRVRNVRPASVNIDYYWPVDELIVPGPWLLADKLLPVGAVAAKVWDPKSIEFYLDKATGWAKGTKIQHSDWHDSPWLVDVEVHIADGVIDRVRFDVPYGDDHKAFGAHVGELMRMRWGKPKQLGKLLVFTGTRTRATAEDSGRVWTLELATTK